MKLLYCVNQLNEGVHISGINAVVMVRPTQSPVIYKQQLGRALDIGNDNEPIVFDLVNNIGSAGHIIAYKDSLQRDFGRLRDSGEEGLFDPKDFIVIDEVRDARFIMREMMEAAAPDLLSIAERRPEIVDEWDYDKNGFGTPYTTSTRSTEKFWWVCSRCGESYRESPLHRTWTRRKRRDCPHCSNKPSLLEKYPEVASLWSVEENGVDAASVLLTRNALNRVSHWHCERGHEWETTIDEQIRQGGCVRCASEIKRKRKRLSRCRPVANEWDFDLNNGSPDAFFNDSGARVWWKCERGHRWKDRIYNRCFLNAGCPFCSGIFKDPGEESLAKLYPELAPQLDLEKERLTADGIRADRRTSLNWICPTCHERWIATIGERVSDPTCPYCSDKRLKPKYNDLETVLPQLSKEWATSGRKPSEVLFTEETEPLVWKCSVCGKRFKATLQSRVQHYRKNCAVLDCPQCHGSKSKAEENRASEEYGRPWLVAGQKVEHARYGVGTIESLSKKRRIVFVRFDVGLRAVTLHETKGQIALKPVSMTLEDIK